jgi:hypothetical protein
MHYKIELEDLTLGEAEELETLTGVTLESIASGRPPVKVLTALLYLVNRRDNPDFTMDDARSIKIAQLEQDGTRPLAGDAS